MKVSKKLILALSCCCVLTLSMTGCSLFKCKHEDTIVENQVTASCANPGYTGDTKCAECGELIQAGMSIAAPDHQTSIVDAKDATCKEEGFTGNAICDVCGTTVIPGEPIAMLQHDGEKIDAKEPTCQEAGFSGDTKCKLCGEVYEKGIVMDVVDHDWVEKEVITQATCKQEGKRVVECRFCKTTMEEKVAKLEHQIVTDPSVEATCETAGKTEGKRCAVCKTVIQEQSVIKALGHDVVTTTKGTDPTCTKDGKASVSRCQRCNKQLTNGEVIKASGHKEVKTAAVEATCTTPGKTEGSTCSVCKTVIKEATSISATGHKNVANAEVAATCESAGKKGGQHCSVCNTVTSESTTIPALGHKPKVVDAKDATCAEEGYTGDEVCEVCNKTIKEGEPIPMIEHTIIDVGNAVAATCTSEGRTSDKICTKCETVVEAGEPIEKLEHEYVEQENTAIEATCTEFGRGNNSVCRLCGDVQEGARVAKKPHTRIEDPSTAKEATCQERGKRADVICGECGKTISKGRSTNKVPCFAVSANDAVESTCTVAGHTASKVCKWCEKAMGQGDPLPLLPHETAERGAIEATCTNKGKTAEVYCTACETVLVVSEDIDMLAHIPAKTGEDYDATCSKTGMIYGTICNICNTQLTEDVVVPVTPHSYITIDNCTNKVVNLDTMETAVVTMKCDNCFETKEFDAVVTNVVVTTQPTCLTTGLATCTISAAVNENITLSWPNVEVKLPIADHTPVETPAQAPTCDADGYTASSICAHCEKVIVEQESIPARHVSYQVLSYEWDKEHQADNCSVTLNCKCNDCEEEFVYRAFIVEDLALEDATCVEDGESLHKVKVKSDKFTENYHELSKVIPAKNHIVSQGMNYDVVNGEAPSYNLTAGEVYDMFECDECNSTFKYIFTGKVEVTKEPTCEEQGQLYIEWYFNEDNLRIDGPAASGSLYRQIAANGHLYNNEEAPEICTVCETHKSIGIDKEMTWWKGSEALGYAYVETLTIQKDIPAEGTYIESWDMDRDDMGYIKAYLVDRETLIFSTMGADELYLNKDGRFVAEMVELKTINGLDMVNISNCDSLTETFAACFNLTTIDISTWETDKETISLKNTFRKCIQLETIKANKSLVEKIIAPELSADEKDETFAECLALVGTVETEGEPIVTVYNAENVGAMAANEYFTYSALSLEDSENA